MFIVFRVDASFRIGSGHLMRCLTLADALKEKGATSHFVHRAHPGHLANMIQKKGYTVTLLPPSDDISYAVEDGDYLSWLGVLPDLDAEQTVAAFKKRRPDWLVVDHYGLDVKWERKLKSHVEKIFVIDDLGSRSHRCDLLLNQNYGSTTEQYNGRVPKDCGVIAGAQYALLRPEFAQWRDFSLRKRSQPKPIKKILVNFGGVDADNYAGRVLSELENVKLPGRVEIVVVLGGTAPHLDSVRKQVEGMQIKATLKVEISNMAELMANADLAIGAGGASNWERCCLGLPTILLVIAENQRLVANALSKANAVKLVDDVSKIPDLLKTSNDWLWRLSQKSRKITDGLGCQNVLMRLGR